MEIKDLKRTGVIHDLFEADWLFYGKAFMAGRPFIKEVLYQHPSETTANFDIRLREAFNFPYCKNIVTIYNYFLTEKPAIREIDKSISNRPDWKKFNKNCDFYGSDFDSFLNEAQKLAGAYGVVGVLVDYPSGNFAKDDDLARPYLSLYTPNNILDWTYERDFASGQPRLTYLKLKEGENSYLIWTPEKWEKYRTSRVSTEAGYAVTDTLTGENRLGEVPFVFLQNVKDTKYPYLGVSDIDDASYVNGAIVRTLSMGNEVMKMAGFPMLLYPYSNENQFLEESNAEDELVVGENAVLQYDPDAKNGKPSWLESPVEASMKSILLYLSHLVSEMYMACNLSGLRKEEEKSQTKSATYLRFEFNQTNAVLAKKADAMVEAERLIYYFFAKWCDIKTEDIEDKVSVHRVEEFSIDALEVELENMIKSTTNVISKTFRTKMQKRMAKRTYPDLTATEIDTIGKEIEQNLEKAEKAAEELAKAKANPDPVTPDPNLDSEKALKPAA